MQASVFGQCFFLFGTIAQRFLNLSQTIPADFIFRIDGDSTLRVNQGLVVQFLGLQHGRETQLCFGKIRVML